MSHTSDGDNIFHNQQELLSAKLEMQFVCIRKKRGEKPQHRTTRNENCKMGSSDFQVSWIEHAIKKAPQLCRGRQWPQIFWH